MVRYIQNTRLNVVDPVDLGQAAKQTVPFVT